MGNLSVFYNGIGTEARAAALAREHLARRFPQRWTHVRGVADRAAWLADRAGLTGEDRALLLVAAWFHDIGYAHPDAYGWHPLDGALLLRGWELDPVANLVAWHTTAAEEAPLLGLETVLGRYRRPDGLVADLLTYADMTTSPDGQTVSFEERRVEVTDRHGPASTPARAMAAAWPRLQALQASVDEALDLK